MCVCLQTKTNFLVNLYWDNKYSDSDSDFIFCFPSSLLAILSVLLLGRFTRFCCCAVVVTVSECCCEAAFRAQMKCNFRALRKYSL